MHFMKKLFYCILTAALALSLTAGCTSSPASGSSSESSSSQSSLPPEQSSESSSSSDGTADSPSQASGYTPAEDGVLRIGSLKGPTSMGLVSMMELQGGESCEFTMAGTADELVPMLVRGELDMAAVPANLASVLYKNTNGAVQVAAINTYGVLYVVETGEAVTSFEDLRGKTVYSTGKGTTPEYVFNYLLSQNGLDPATDLTIEYKSESTEVAALLAQSEDAIAVLPQPYVTIAQSQNENLRIALDFTAEWDKLQQGVDSPSSLVTGVLVIRKELAEQKPQLLQEFLAAYETSTHYTNESENAPALIEKYGIVPSAAVAQKALPYCNITFVKGQEMKEKVSGYLQVLFEQNPASIGGALPEDDFYYLGE